MLNINEFIAIPGDYISRYAIGHCLAIHKINITDIEKLTITARTFNCGTDHL